MNNGEPKWIWWLVTTGAIVTLLFVCSMGTLIIRSEYRDEINNLLNSQPNPTLVVRSTLPAQSNGNLIGEEIPVATKTPIIAPTVTQRALVTSPPIIPTGTATSAGRVTAFRMAVPPMIDGDLAGWGNTPSYPAIYPVYVISDWDGSDDLQGYWRLAWDDLALYVGVVVIDDVHVQMASYGEIFLGDSVEIQIDVELEADYGSVLTPDDFQLALSPGDFQTRMPQAWQWQATAAGHMESSAHKMRVAAVQTKQGYVLEAEIPWQGLGVRPAAGLTVGIALNINDNDTVGSKRQEMMKSHIASRSHGDPSSWGTLILGE